MGEETSRPSGKTKLHLLQMEVRKGTRWYELRSVGRHDPASSQNRSAKWRQGPAWPSASGSPAGPL
eukprot:655911-Pyramimonas_sp.AAC.1